MKWYLLYATTHKEAEVAEDLRLNGFDVIYPEKIEFVRSGNNRYAERKVSPYLPNYIFADIPNERFMSVICKRFIASTLHPLSKADIQAVKRFSERACLEMNEAEKIFAESQKERGRNKAVKRLVAQFKEGQALQMLDGSLSDMMLAFKALVERAQDRHPMIHASAEFMGAERDVYLDPMNVKAAE